MPVPSAGTQPRISVDCRVSRRGDEARVSIAVAAVSAWAGGLFFRWTALANAAAVGLGAAVVRSGYPAAWAGWALIGAALIFD